MITCGRTLNRNIGDVPTRMGSSISSHTIHLPLSGLIGETIHIPPIYGYLMNRSAKELSSRRIVPTISSQHSAAIQRTLNIRQSFTKLKYKTAVFSAFINSTKASMQILRKGQKTISPSSYSLSLRGLLLPTPGVP